MRIGAVWVASLNAYSRAIGPLEALARRGHDIVWPADTQGEADVARLGDCNVVLVYRRADPATRAAIAELLEAGVAVVYDNDDDLTAVPEGVPSHDALGGEGGAQAFAASVAIARQATAFTTPTEALGRLYRDQGVEAVEVLGNYLAPHAFRESRPQDGVVVGWVATADHVIDAERIDVAGALAHVVAKHPEVRVECIGVDLGLSERYRHDPLVAFHELPERIAGFDIGLAPLADIPFNRSRSDLKVKEYAAAETAWLASPVGPYAGLGPEQGGHLVPDDGWAAALSRLVTDAPERRRLADQAAGWARTQSLDAAAHGWERVLAAAAGIQGSRGAGPAFTVKPWVNVRLRPRRGGRRTRSD